MKYSLSRMTEELAQYAIERQFFPSPHQDHPRDEWIRNVLRGIAEVSGEDGSQSAANFDQWLETAQGMPPKTRLTSFEQKHMIRSLCRYAAELEQLEGDQRGRVLDVLKLLNDISICLSWHLSHTGIFPAREQVAEQLLRMQLRLPHRFTFTRVFVGADTGPCGADFLPGQVNDLNSVRNTPIFQKLTSIYPHRREWPAVCTIYLSGGPSSGFGAVDADELDMAVIREAGDRFLKQPGVRPVCSRELRVPVCQRADVVSELAHSTLPAPQKAAGKVHKRKEAER
ncbi:MAG: hypothetical protein K2P26_04755 [Oscillospiraceae bacterium]|nr:hypothetical protein [Oscillospiraceae bacterium]